MSASKKPTAVPSPTSTYPMVFETVNEPEHGVIRFHSEPYVFNGRVYFRRYRVTVEEIVEPVDVLGERLQGLWNTSTNGHDWEPLRDAAAALGVALGVRRPRQPKGK